MEPAKVADWMDGTGPALNQFWAHNKTDCLELKKTLEARTAAGVAASAAVAQSSRSRARTVALRGIRIAAWIDVSNQMLEDSTFDIGQLLAFEASLFFP
jgi:HK97 family phage major capsid protein